MMGRICIFCQASWHEKVSGADCHQYGPDGHNLSFRFANRRVSRFTGEDRIINSSRLELGSLAKSSKQKSVQGLQAELLILLFFPDGSISTQIHTDGSIYRLHNA